MNTQSIRKRRINNFLFLFLLLLSFQFGCDTEKHVQQDSGQPVNKIAFHDDRTKSFDTIFYFFPQLKITNAMIYDTLDSLIDEKNSKILKSDTVPFYGSVYLKMREFNDSLSFLLTNMQSSLYDNELFLKSISGVFSYRGIFFFAVIDSNFRQNNNHIQILETKMKAFALKLMEGNLKVMYPVVVLRKGYLFENNKFLLNSTYFDRIHPDFRVENRN